MQAGASRPIVMAEAQEALGTPVASPSATDGSNVYIETYGCQMNTSDSQVSDRPWPHACMQPSMQCSSMQAAFSLARAGLQSVTWGELPKEEACGDF